MKGNKQKTKLGVWTETITLALSQDDYIIEKVEFEEFQKWNVEFLVTEGTKALIKGILYNSGAQIKFDKKELQSSKTIYLCKASWNINVDIQKFFGGSYELGISISPSVKGSFSIVGSASVEIDDFKTLINYFNKTMTRKELEEAISNDFKKHAKDDIFKLASQYITSSSTEQDLAAKLPDIEQAFQKNSNKSNVKNMGIRVTKITLGINTLPDTDEMIKKIKEELTQRGLREINADETKRLAEEEDKQRKHELELERIKKMTITEKKEDIKKEINSTVVRDGTKEQEVEKTYCLGCGKLVEDKTAKFCKYCGEKISFNDSEKEEKEVKIYCSGCGKLVEEKTAKFCKHCGKEII